MNILSPIIRHGLPSAAVALHLFVAACASAAELPSVQELIRQTSEACDEYEKETDEGLDWPLMNLARAHAYAADDLAAIKVVRSMKGDIWRSTALLLCWEIRCEREGKGVELPSLEISQAARELGIDDSTRLEAAEFLIKSGWTEEAKAYLPGDPQNEVERFGLIHLYLSLAQHQIEKGDRGACAANLQRAWNIAEKFKDDYRRLEWLHTMVEIWLTLGDKERAAAGKDAALELLQQRSTRDDPSSVVALAWAKQGKFHVKCDEDKLAREAFQQAIRMADAADQADEEAGFYDADYRVGDHSETLGRIGAAQFAAGFNVEASECYEKAWERVKQVKDLGKREFYLLKLVDRQRAEGDVQAALKTIEQMRTPYYRATAACHCAESLAAKGQKAEAEKLLSKAEALAIDDANGREKPDLFVTMAEVQAKGANLSAARQSLLKAVEFSRKMTDRDGHSWVARCQTRLGFLEDAYDTILATPKLNYRLLPLAELTEAVAKKEAMSRKKEAKK